MSGYLQEQYFMIRSKGYTGGDYYYGFSSSSPKLYSLGTARSIVGRFEKEHERQVQSAQKYNRPIPTKPVYEIVPVTIVPGEPVK